MIASLHPSHAEEFDVCDYELNTLLLKLIPLHHVILLNVLLCSS